MEEGALFRVIDVYLSDTAFPPLLQASRFQDDPEEEEEEEEEEGLVFVVDESTQEQMRALGLPTRFSSVPCKRVSRRLRRSGRSHQVASSLDEQCSRKLCDGIDQVWAAQLDANNGSRAPEKEANYGEGAPSEDHQASKSVCLSIRDDLMEASFLGVGAIDGCGRSALVARVQADVSTIHELGILHESRGCLAHERAGILDGGGPFDEKEANSGSVNMSNGHSLEGDCKRKVASYETNHFTEDAIIGSSRNPLEGSDFVELTSGVDDHGANNEEASLLRCGVIDGTLSLSCGGMVAQEAINELGSVSNSRQPHAKEGERISSIGDLSATKDVSIAETTLTPTDGALVSEEPFAFLCSTRAAAQGEQLTTLSGSNQESVSEGSIGICDARANDVLVKGVEQELLIEEGSRIKTPEVLSWSACWDDHYGRYYFYNIETLESTWEPPQGFESYAYLSAAEVNSKAFQDGSVNVISNGEELVVEESEKERAPSEDGFKSDTLLHGPLEPEAEALPIVTTVKEALKSSGNCLVYLQSNFVHGTDGTLPAKEGTIKGPEVVLESSVCQVIAHSANKSGVVQEDAATFKVLEPTRRAKMAARCLARLENHGLDVFAAMGDHSPTIFKYWAQRFHLFSKYDLGVKLDEEGWFSVTPEVIAKHQAAHCRHGVVVDAFTGVGGNAIQFALAGHYVVAIDNDPKKIEYARHNATIYGVADRIDFVLGDFFVVAPQLQADVVFLSPPWGGPDYLSVKVYDILTMLQPKDGISLFKVAQTVASNVIFFLPRNVDVNQLAELSKTLSSPCFCEVERNYLNGKLKSVTAYYGQFASMEET